MEVRAHLRKRCDRLYKLFCDDPWFQRSQTNPFDSFNLMHCTNQTEQIVFIFKINAIGAQMNSRQHDFLVSVFRQICHFCYYIFFCPASDSSSRIRDNTVRTKLVAAILHLDICSRMLPLFCQMQILIFFCMIDIDHFPQITVCFFICLQRCQKILLFIVSEYNINTWIDHLLFSLCLLLAGRASAQWVVTDPTNLAQGIVNTTKQIIQTSSTASNMLNNFQETVKIYEQGKKYYDALKSVNNLVKDARKVQKTILMIGEISDTYVVSFQKMMRDENYTVEELGAIAFGYTKLLEESNDVLQEMKGVVNITTLSLSDKERMDVVDRCYNSVRQYRNLVGYYTNKNIAVSYLRSKKKGDTNRVLALYGDTNDRYW